jgi:hypothetical protein
MKISMSRMFAFFLMYFLVLTICVNLSYGQDEKYPRGAQYFLGTNDQLLIKVNIWGFVAKPGQYLIPSDTDLISLISFAGGPIEGAKLSKIKLIRSIEQKGKNQNVLTVDVKKFADKGDASIIPRIKPGDTIIISGTTWYHLSKLLTFVRDVALVVQMYFMISYYSTRN